MKYLYLIIRHIFPRKRWKEVERIGVSRHSGEGKDHALVIVLKDQFGNIKTKRIRA